MGEESSIERILARKVKKMGGLAVKFVSPGLDGVPDRIVLLPGRKMAFVELKAPGKKLRALQEKRKRQLESLGFPVYVIDGVEQIGGVLDEICAT
ncbi:VRR-NUC domain-containing protein [Enterocloster aldenensis]|uniref:VRR-NUC domain-containing protein n=1 Tax=Enterocloster aldenensis TaxID=358742 RepID=UPI001D065EEB|nr:VRR-NUC domain-containing protein [Enterocloster aldenensis]